MLNLSSQIDFQSISVALPFYSTKERSSDVKLCVGSEDDEIADTVHSFNRRNESFLMGLVLAILVWSVGRKHDRGCCHEWEDGEGSSLFSSRRSWCHNWVAARTTSHSRATASTPRGTTYIAF